ncbi:unnamed protein product [Rhizophagus irregularis]|nr:unnamed protein product [Rhizophagus irregularis]CAB5358452.1 unnamed protein product [Rhizophagus irregularis]
MKDKIHYRTFHNFPYSTVRIFCRISNESLGILKNKFIYLDSEIITRQSTLVIFGVLMEIFWYYCLRAQLC